VEATATTFSVPAAKELAALDHAEEIPYYTESVWLESAHRVTEAEVQKALAHLREQ
jgi:hypothetical protein